MSNNNNNLTTAATTSSGGGVVEPNPINSLMPTFLPWHRSWSPRLHIQNMNDVWASGPLDRLDFWSHFVQLFWADSPVALKLKLGAPNMTVEEHDLPTTLVPFFFHTWQQAASFTRIQLLINQVTEGVLPAGFPFLTGTGVTLETIGAEGGLLVRQHARCRMIFDHNGHLVQWEVQIVAHDEYLLAGRAGLLLASNSNNGGLWICPWGLPASVYRWLDLVTIMKELPWGAWLGKENNDEDKNEDNLIMGMTATNMDKVAPSTFINGRALKPLRKRRKTPPPSLNPNTNTNTNRNIDANINHSDVVTKAQSSSVDNLQG